MTPYKNHTSKLELIKSKKLDLSENVDYFITNIKNSELNAFNSVYDDEARIRANVIQQKILEGNNGKLAGMVVSIKDVLAIKGKPLTCSSRILKDFVSQYNATVVDRLLKEDVIIIGKTNCDEFAMGSSNENSYFGNVKNPVNSDYVPGGSSGGAAASVAANLCDLAIGSDTGGSVRQPAAFCGIWGYKPTYGLFSRYGLTAYASSFDSVGILSKNPVDIDLVAEVLADNDYLDSTSFNGDFESIKSNRIDYSKKIRVGLPSHLLNKGLDSEIKTSIIGFAEELKSKNIEIVDIEIPLLDYAISTYYILVTAEASSNLERYDGIHFGFRSKSETELSDVYSVSRDLGFGDEVKKRIMLGTYVLSAGYYDAYYQKATKVRNKIRVEFERIFNKVDIILMPTTPSAPFKFGEKNNDPIQMFLEDIYTIYANLVGIPSINIPLGSHSNKLPIGAQLLSWQFNDFMLLDFVKNKCF